MKDTGAVMMQGGDWGLGRCVERAGSRGRTYWEAETGARLLSSEGHGCSHDAASGVRLSDGAALKGEQKAKRETE